MHLVLVIVNLDTRWWKFVLGSTDIVSFLLSFYVLINNSSANNVRDIFVLKSMRFLNDTTNNGKLVPHAIDGKHLQRLLISIWILVLYELTLTRYKKLDVKIIRQANNCKKAVGFLFNTCKEGGRTKRTQGNNQYSTFDEYNINITETTTEQQIPTYNIKLQLNPE
ncbi:hypothetical protein H5410_043811, partial [Solanum commersonii]